MEKKMSLPFADGFSAPARIQRLTVFAIATILLFIFFQSSAIPGSVSIPSIHKQASL
jgi:hypothetical protein